MRFTVPQFIERESPIAGPLTLKQLFFIGGAGIVCIILYFVISNFVLFILMSIVALGIGIAMAFLKISGFSIPTVLTNLLKFNISPKMYIWRKETKSIEDQITAETYKAEK